MLIAVLSGFIVSFLILIAGNLLKGYRSLLISLLPISLFVYFLDLIPKVANGAEIIFRNNWIPSMGIQLDFTLDGLSLLFCLLITGIGSLVFLYASAYMKNYRYTSRFFCYLSMFMGSMLGLVLSDNVIALFVFWELTSITSFFLIGFNNENGESRKSAVLALGITGGGGFLLMAGFILMGSINGNYSIAEMAANSDFIQNHGLYGLMLALVLAGAFTKSAQFPFHFWLPGAMKAPTPVSAYLHSATMVKAGVYLLARFTPVLGDTIYWNSALMVVGGITMLYAAFHTLFRTDLKSILAYSTIAALGILVFLLGIGTQEALIAAAVFIIVHALYKAGLFLITGIIDHETGTRNVAELGGLRKLMLPVAIAGLLAAISSAGMPFTIGFLGKELIYESTIGGNSLIILITTIAVLTNIFLLYAGFVAGIKPFFGKLPVKLEKTHMPPFLMWFPPLLLGILGIIWGIFPASIDETIVQPVVNAMHSDPIEHSLKIWHGFTWVLALSGITLAAGIALYYFHTPKIETIKWVHRYESISPETVLKRSTDHIVSFAHWFTKIFQNGYLRNYILIIIIFISLLLAYKLFTGVRIFIDYSKLNEITIYEGVIVGIMLVAILKTVYTKSRRIAVVSMGIVGYCICLIFVFYSAPDLAMTQFTIDTLTVVLFVLVLFRLPHFLRLSNRPVKIRDAVVALSFGTLLSIIALEVINENINKETSVYYAENAYELAKGKNVVNVILVDFRGVDTLIEITVLAIAAIGVYSMLKLKIGPTVKE